MSSRITKVQYQKIEAGGAKNFQVSLIRGVALSSIICCHIMQYLGMELAWWFNVGVQIFLCISGFLYGQKRVDNAFEFVKSRFFKLLPSYYIVFIFWGLMQLLFLRNIFSVTKFARGLLLNSVIVGGEHLWFVPTILMCYFITPIIQLYFKSIDNKKNEFDKCFIICFIAINIFFGLFNNYFNPAWISCYVIGYFLGINEKNRFFSTSNILVFLIPATFIINGIKIILKYFVNIEFVGSKYFYDYSHVLLGVTIFLVLYNILKKVNLGKIGGLLNLTDRYSYEVYLVHQFVILGPFSLMKITNNMFCNIMMIFCVIIFMAWILKKVISLYYQHRDLCKL